MVNQSDVRTPPLGDDAAFEEFVASVFRLNRTIRSTQGLWVQLPGGLKRSDVTILKAISEHGECRPGAIAEQLGVGPSVISRQLAALDEGELITRRRDPDDGRAELVTVTERGRDRLSAMRTAYLQGLRAQFTDWDEAKALAAAALLDEISDHIAPALGRDPRRDVEPNQKEEA